MTELTVGAAIGPFTLVEAMPAGHGGMARVYIASVRQTPDILAAPDTLPERVAIKVARIIANDGSANEQAFYLEALNNEVETLKRLRHPNIIRLFPIPRGLPRNPYAARATELEGAPWFCVMEYLGGGSLENRLKTLGALPLAEAMEIAYQISLALDHIHLKGMAHLDLKPDNILFRYAVGAAGSPLRNLQPVLIDFGIAAKLRKVGPQAGSIPFMAPERVRLMRGEVAPELHGNPAKADVYGVGVLLYRMLTGHLPYEGLPRDQLTSAILDMAPKSPREINTAIPPKVEEIILATLDKEPNRRPPIEEIISRLDEAMVARPPAPPPLLRKDIAKSIRRPLLTLVLATLLASCALVSLLEFGIITSLINQPTSIPTVVATITATPLPTEPPTATPTLPATPTPFPATATRTP